MKRRALALSVVLMLVFSAVYAKAIRLGKSDPINLQEFPMTVTILSPKDNAVFSVNHFQLNFTVTEIPRDKIDTRLQSVNFGINIMEYGEHVMVYYVNYSLSNPLSAIRQSVALTNLTEGEHDFTVTAFYILDFSYRNIAQLKGTSKPIHVTIDAEPEDIEPEPHEPEPFPTSLVIAASGVSVTIAGVGLLLYFMKRKH
jgi:hypothetical protein